MYKLKIILSCQTNHELTCLKVVFYKNVFNIHSFRTHKEVSTQTLSIGSSHSVSQK